MSIRTSKIQVAYNKLIKKQYIPTGASEIKYMKIEMPNKTRLEEQSSPGSINALNNNKHIKITYLFLFISTLNEVQSIVQSVVQSTSFDK